MDNGGGGTPSAITNANELGQQAGETMASVDESGGSSGTIASLFPFDQRAVERTFNRWAPGEREKRRFSIWPEAFADSCVALDTFSSCSNNVITRTFSDCSIGFATLSGTVTLTWDDDAVDNTCKMTQEGHSISRDPEFTATGLRGATLHVEKTGVVGQRITRGSQAGTFTFTNDGIRRSFKNANNKTLFDFTTTTVDGINITGTSRANRVVDGGVLRVKNNKTDVTCDITPSNVTWESTCNCATSGSWSGTCSDSDSITIDITGCGSATLTKGSTSISVEFDRCFPVALVSP